MSSCLPAFNIADLSIVLRNNFLFCQVSTQVFLKDTNMVHTQEYPALPATMLLRSFDENTVFIQVSQDLKIRKFNGKACMWNSY